jgi:hypothetical protein
MCFSLPASLIAGTIGVGSGIAITLLRSCIGVFVVWYSLVQFAEAAIYAGGNRQVLDRILLVLLGSQLAVFVAVTWKNTPGYRALAAAAAGIATYTSLAAAPVSTTSPPPVVYPFTPTTNKLMVAQYVLILGTTFLSASRSTRCMGTVLTGTMVASFLLRGVTGGSLWCWLSAVAGPVMFFSCPNA